MTDDLRPKLGNTTRDLVTSIARGTTGMVPVVGSLIAEVVGNVIPNQRIDRIVRFVELMEARLGSLEQGILRTKLLHPEAVDILEDAFTQAARATTQSRLEHIANIVANGLRPEDLEVAQVKRMLWLLGQLNDEEIVILRSGLARTREELLADTDFRRNNEPLLAPDATDLGSNEEEIEEAALKASYRQHLFDLGLVRHRFRSPRRGELPEFDIKTGMIKAQGSDLTRLGRMLIEYLDLIPNWYRS